MRGGRGRGAGRVQLAAPQDLPRRPIGWVVLQIVGIVDVGFVGSGIDGFGIVGSVGNGGPVRVWLGR